jgi:ribulose-5-phosphate 4-epimerase/fuculose-1-phosphate aldolase
MSGGATALARDDLELSSASKLADMCRLLSEHNLIGMFGHVSIRIAGTSRMLISPGAGSDKSNVRPTDLFIMDLDGTVLYNPGAEVPIEWRIHTRIHSDREDAVCVAHLHGHHATVLGIARKELRPMFTQAAFLCETTPVWDDARLVMSEAQAASLSKTMGNNAVVQMRGHGSVVVGRSAEEAFFNSIFMEQNARYQLEAGAIGEAFEIDPQQARECMVATRNDRLYRLVWAYHDKKSRDSKR